MAGRDTPRNRSGITLTELMIVIAIIVLLAAILFPVFHSVRAASKRAVCASNLKQLCTALEAYTMDWSETLPCPGGLPGELTYWAQEGGGIEYYVKNQRMGLQSVYCCPLFPGRWRAQWSPRTYGMNSFLRDPADIPFPWCIAYLSGVRKSDIVEPARTILLYEGIPADETNPLGEGYIYRCGNWEWVRGYYPKPILHWNYADVAWHGRRNNYLFCDGHAKSMHPERYPAFRGPTSSANNLWYVQKFRD